jgi:histidine kinase
MMVDNFVVVDGDQAHVVHSSKPAAATNMEEGNQGGNPVERVAAQSSITHMNLQPRLYHRTLAMETLTDAYARCTSATRSTPEITIITGLSGTGKTALAHTLKEAVSDAGGLFLSGKYDQLEKPENLYPIINIFNAYFASITSSADDALNAVLQEAVKVVSVEPILADILTPFHHLKKEEPRSRGSQIAMRVNVGLCRLFQVLASERRPVVLFLDDLQWAETASIDLLSSLVTLFDIPGLMILGTIRSDEMFLHQRLSVTLRELESQSVRITNIELENLPLDGIRDMLSDMLNVPTTECLAMANLLHMQSKGNLMFLHQLIQYYVSEHLIQWCSNTESWRWNYDDIIRRVVTFDDPIKFLSQQIQRLQADVEEVIVKASCFGSTFEFDLLVCVVSHDNVQTSIHLLEQMGYVQAITRNTWRFCHDQIQQSAYSLIQQDRIEQMHLDIRLQLWHSLPPEQLSEHMFAVVNQLRRGAHIITEENERENLASLLLEAGNAAITQSSFALAATHLHLAISLLGRRHWRDQYLLSLNLYDTAAEVENCNGNFEQVDKLIQEVLDNARSHEDKLRSLTLSMYSFGCRHQLAKAISIGRSILRSIGFALPSSTTLPTIFYELFKTKRRLHNLSNQDILSLPLMRDSKAQVAIQVITFMIFYSLLSQPRLFAILVLRRVQLTIQYGLSNIAPLAFGSLSNIMATVLKDIPGGLRMASLALDLQKKCGNFEWLSRLNMSVHGLTLPWSQPLRDQLGPLLYAHRIGLGSGDIESAMLCYSLYLSLAFPASVDLQSLCKNFQTIIKLHHFYKQAANLMLVSVGMQCVCNFISPSNNPLKLTGEIMGENGHQESAIAAGNTLVSDLMWQFKLFLASYFHEYETGAAIITEIKRCSRSIFVFTKRAIVFHSGLIYAALASQEVN